MQVISSQNTGLVNITLSLYFFFYLCKADIDIGVAFNICFYSVGTWAVSLVL